MARPIEQGLQWDKVVMYGVIGAVAWLNISAMMGNEIVPLELLAVLDLLVISLFLSQ